MGVFQERVKQKTHNATLCTAAVSSDQIRWRDIEVIDISSAGLAFFSTKLYNIGQVLSFELKVYSMVTEFNIVLEGRVDERENIVDGYNYNIKFHNIEKHVQIQLDEIINANIASKNTHEVTIGDGIYSFILNPKSLSTKSRSGKY